MSAEQWSERLAMLAEHVSGAGGSWLTVRPIGPDAADLLGPAGPGVAPAVAGRDSEAAGHRSTPWPVVPVEIDGVTVVVSCEADARRRMASVLASLAAAGVGSTLTEAELSTAFALPAPCEPDLAVLLGRDDELPRSLSWELAYAEVVFIPAPWTEVDPIVVKAAVAEYFTRNRRFGGVDG